MKSLILSTATRYLFPLLMLFSVFLLMRGHNEPGGGFVGGLVAATAFVLYSIAYSIREARRVMRIEPIQLIALGLLTSISSGMIALLLGKNLMTGIWVPSDVPILSHLGTPILFDIGVYLVVLGITMMIIFALSEEN